MDLENKTIPEEPKKKGRGLGAAISIGLLAGVIGAFGVMNYDNLIVPLYKKAASGVTSFYKRVAQEYQFKKKYEINRTYPSPNTSGVRSSSSQTDVAVDEFFSNIKILPNTRVKDVLGKNVEEFYKSTEPEDVVKEITKGAVREVTKETLKAGAEAVDELSNYISSPKAREEALQKATETVQEVFGSPEVREAASELGKSLKGLFNTMKK